MESKSEFNDNSKRFIGITAIIALFFIGTTGFLYFDNKGIRENSNWQKVQLSTLDDAATMFQTELKATKAELEKYKGKSKEMEILVSSAETQMAIKEQTINKLLSENASLKNLKKELVALRAENRKYLKRLIEQKGNTSGDSETMAALIAENEELKKQLEFLTSENNELKRKVQLASELEVENIFVVAEKKTNDGDYSNTKVKKADRLSVVFYLDKNKVAEAGERSIFLRLIDDSEKVIENRGSGYFLNKDKNVSLRYSVEKIVSYNNKRERVVIPVYILPGKHDKGRYRVELYCDGQLLGTRTVELK